jgi:hypothetical protein
MKKRGGTPRCFLVTRDDEPRLTEEKCNLAVDMAWCWRLINKGRRDFSVTMLEMVMEIKV